MSMVWVGFLQSKSNTVCRVKLFVLIITHLAMDIVELAGMCGGFALLRCHVLPPVFLCLTHASAH